jgi:hypothetical protein
MNEKKGRCFFPSAQKIESIGFVHSKTNMYNILLKCRLHINEEVRLYYKVWINMYNILLKCRLQSFVKQKSKFFLQINARHES